MKLFKSRKALSPVVASIILIAVTVAVSIAVAAWMGALTFTFTATEQLQITYVDFVKSGNSPTNTIYVRVRNSGNTPVTITEAWVNGVAATIVNATNARTIDANSAAVLQVQMSNTWNFGANYQVKLLSSKGNQFYYTATAPSS
ncbi:MAG: archaellin/type IV pilin N-terminal domain-containing protein [Candidatus Bathyarchaeia archaeon]